MGSLVQVNTLGMRGILYGRRLTCCLASRLVVFTRWVFLFQCLLIVSLAPPCYSIVALLVVPISVRLPEVFRYH